MVLPFLAALAPFAPLIGGAINAVWSFMSANQAAEAAKQPVRNSVDFKQLVADARAAGFNPLTVLRSGGAAGYTQTHAPALSSISPLGEGLQAIGGAVSAFQWDPLAERRAQVEFGIAQETLAGLQRDNRTPRVTFDVPSYQAASSKKAAPWTAPQPKSVPLERVGRGAPQEAPGAISDIGWVRTATGFTPVPSKDAKERIEDDVFQQGLWFTRNILAPQFGFAKPPFPNFLGDEKSYRWNSFANEWQRRPGTVDVGGSF